MHKLRDTPGDPQEDLKRAIEKIAGEDEVYVLGLGNTDRADDGAGVLVAEQLKKRFPSHSFSEHDGVEGTVLDISERKGDALVLFVDAADMCEPPGTLRLVRREDIKVTEITTHRVAVALMASILERAGKRSAVVCIQPQRIEFRGEVSYPVRRTIAQVARTLEEVMRKRDR